MNMGTEGLVTRGHREPYAVHASLKSICTDELYELTKLRDIFTRSTEITAGLSTLHCTTKKKNQNDIIAGYTHHIHTTALTVTLPLLAQAGGHAYLSPQWITTLVNV